MIFVEPPGIFVEVWFERGVDWRVVYRSVVYRSVVFIVESKCEFLEQVFVALVKGSNGQFELESGRITWKTREKSWKPCEKALKPMKRA